MESKITYKYSNFSLLVIAVLAVVISCIFKWSYAENPINFMGGDAEDYYSSLISTFINGDVAHQSREVWFLIKTNTGTINQHPVGVAVLLLPFFLLAYAYASLFHFPVDGLSFPFQIAVGLAAFVYAMIGLIFIKKLFQLRGISDKVTALILPLLFFGTNLMHYTLSEAGMSHIYSFSMISVFLYQSAKFVQQRENKNLLAAFAIVGLIILLRPNNVFIVLGIFFWFSSLQEFKDFFRSLFKNKIFYFSFLLTASIVFLQSLLWYFQSKQFFHQTYKADGFYWLNPQVLKMLLGFDGGFFIYTPLCLLFLLGLIVVYRENKFAFVAFSSLFVLVFYLFGSYCSYTFFDGLGIRVLVDYYAVFALLGAKLFMQAQHTKWVIATVLLFAVLFSFLSLIYTYQANRSIMLRAGMTFTKWKYIFLKTGKDYQNCLGGSHELKPYAAKQPLVSLSAEMPANTSFDYTGKDFGLNMHFDSLGFNSNRIHVKVDCKRREKTMNAAKDAFICMSLEDKATHKNKYYVQFKLNEVPSTTCCDESDYHYSMNASADFKRDDLLSVYVWNINKEAFLINKFSVQIYNYNYHIN